MKSDRRTGGVLRSENAGMSSERRVRIPSTECLRFPEEALVRSGLVRPKPRPTGVGDGQQVDIPVPPLYRLSNGGTQKDRRSVRLVVHVQAVRLIKGKSAYRSAELMGKLLMERSL